MASSSKEVPAMPKKKPRVIWTPEEAEVVCQAAARHILEQGIAGKEVLPMAAIRAAQIRALPPKRHRVKLSDASAGSNPALIARIDALVQELAVTIERNRPEPVAEPEPAPVAESLPAAESEPPAEAPEPVVPAPTLKKTRRPAERRIYWTLEESEALSVAAADRIRVMKRHGVALDSLAALREVQPVLPADRRRSQLYDRASLAALLARIEAYVDNPPPKPAPVEPPPVAEAIPEPVAEPEPSMPLAPEGPPAAEVAPNALQPLISELARRLASQIAHALEAELTAHIAQLVGSLPLANAVPRPNLSNLTAAVVEKAKRPALRKVLVIGLRPDNAAMLQNEFGKGLDLRFCDPDVNLKALQDRITGVDEVVLMCNFVSHKHADAMRMARKWHRLHGGMTTIRNYLQGLLQAA